MSQLPTPQPTMGSSLVASKADAGGKHHKGTKKTSRKPKRRWRYKKPVIVNKPWIVSSLCSWMSAPGSCLYVTVCPWCAIAEQRTEIMKEQSKTLKDYKCFALMYPGPCFCACDVCNDEIHKPLERNCTGGCYLCWEVLMCTPCAVRGNRYLFEQRYGLAPERWEVCLDRCPFPYFTLDCCTVPCIPCIMTQQIVQWNHEKKTVLKPCRKIASRKNDPIPFPMTGIASPTACDSIIQEDTDESSDSFQSARSTSDDDCKSCDNYLDTSQPTLSQISSGEFSEARGESAIVSLNDRVSPLTRQVSLRRRRRSSFVLRAFHQIGDGRGINLCHFLRDNQYVVLDLSSGDDMPIIAHVSNRFAALTGYDESELVGRTYDVLFGPNTNPVCIAQMKQLLKAGEEGFVYLTNKRKDETPFNNIMYLCPFIPPARVGEESQLSRYMLGCQCDSGDDDTRMRLTGLTDPALNPHPKTNILIRYGTSTYLPNVGPGRVNSPYFDGCFFLKTLTDPPDLRVASYFEGRRRRFELQIQGEFKTPITGDIYLNLHLADQLKLGFASRGIVRMMGSGIKRRSKGSISTMGDEYPEGKPGMALPLGISLDRLVITNNSSGQVPPIVNVDMFPEPIEVVTKYELGVTYSFSFHSAFMDLENWSIRGLPGISSVSMSNVTGTQALHVSLTMVPPGETPEKMQSTGIHLVDMEIVHVSLPCYPTDGPAVSEDAATTKCEQLKETKH